MIDDDAEDEKNVGRNESLKTENSNKCVWFELPIHLRGPFGLFNN